MRLYAMKGGRWAGTQADARTIDTEFAQIEVPTDKPGLLAFLNRNAVEPVEYWPNLNAAPVQPEPRDSLGASPAERPVDTLMLVPPGAKPVFNDEQFDALPLARQLHFAALAMENARACLKGDTP